MGAVSGRPASVPVAEGEGVEQLAPTRKRPATKEARRMRPHHQDPTPPTPRTGSWALPRNGAALAPRPGHLFTRITPGGSGRHLGCRDDDDADVAARL